MTDEQTAWFKRLVNAGVPKVEAAMLATGSIRETQALAYAKEFIQNFNGGGQERASMLVLAGPTGVGKTIASCYVLMHQFHDPATGMVRPTGCRFRHVSAIAEVGLFGGDDDKRSRKEWRETGCLVVDDVGSEYVTDGFLALFDALVNHRYGEGTISCFTTNLTAEDFGKRYGARVYDRLRGRGAWIEINHESLRSPQ